MSALNFSIDALFGPKTTTTISENLRKVSKQNHRSPTPDRSLSPESAESPVVSESHRKFSAFSSPISSSQIRPERPDSENSEGSLIAPDSSTSHQNFSFPVSQKNRALSSISSAGPNSASNAIPNLHFGQSWPDVLIPHLQHIQLAAGNPFFGGNGMSPSTVPGGGAGFPDFAAGGKAQAPSPNSIQEMVQRNALAAFHQRQNPLWQQHWMDFLNQAGAGSQHHRFYQGSSDTPHPGMFLQSFRKPKRIRTAFNPGQLIQLEDSFDQNHYVVGAERKQLAQRLNLTETQVKVWFQNRRTKHKRVKTEEDCKSNSSSSSHQKLEKTPDISPSVSLNRQARAENDGRSRE